MKRLQFTKGHTDCQNTFMPSAESFSVHLSVGVRGASHMSVSRDMWSKISFITKGKICITECIKILYRHHLWKIIVSAILPYVCNFFMRWLHSMGDKIYNPLFERKYILSAAKDNVIRQQCEVDKRSRNLMQVYFLVWIPGIVPQLQTWLRKVKWPLTLWIYAKDFIKK